MQLIHIYIKASVNLYTDFIFIVNIAFSFDTILTIQLRLLLYSIQTTEAMANDSTYILYNYDPSAVAAIIFVVLFGLTTLVHIFQMIRSRSWFFIPFIIGGICKYIPHSGTNI